MPVNEDATDRGQSKLLVLGGMSAIVLGMSYVIITALYVSAGAVPTGGEAWLRYLGGQTGVWWGILGLSVLTDFLFLPVLLALYVALRPVNRTPTIVGVGLLAAFVVLDLTVTWPNFAALLMLSTAFSATAEAAEQVTLVAAASYPSAVLASAIFSVYAILVPSLGILIISWVMRRGLFERTTAWLGLLSGAFGIVAVTGPIVWPALGIVAVLASVLTTMWLLVVGRRLWRLAAEQTTAGALDLGPLGLPIPADRANDDAVSKR